MIDGKLDPEPINGLPKTYSQNTTGGYMDIALDPNFSQNEWVYFAFSHTNGNPFDKGATGWDDESSTRQDCRSSMDE